MSYVHYRFKSAVTFETVTFDGMHISVADLKKAISQQKNLGKFKEAFDLQLTRPQSTEVYKDTDLIPRNSSVIVARIPVERSSRSRPWDSSRVDMSTAQSAQKMPGRKPSTVRKLFSPSSPTTNAGKVKKMACRFCNTSVADNGMRMIAHILICKKCPESVSAKYTKDHPSVTFSHTNSTASGSSGTGKCVNETTGCSTSMTIKSVTDEKPGHKWHRSTGLCTMESFLDSVKPAQKNEIDEAIARAVYASGAPLSMTDNVYWKAAFKKIRPAYELPSRYKLTHTFLNAEYERVNCTVNEQIAGADALALMCDGWSNIRNESIINFVVTTPKPTFYKSVATGAESHTGEFMATIMLEVLNEIGTEKFIGIVTDNAANMKNAWVRIQTACPHLVCYGCAAHGIQLLLSDVFSIQSVANILQKSKSIVKHINGSHRLRALLSVQQKTANCKCSLKMPVQTRWGSSITCLDSVLANRTSLQHLAIDEGAQPLLSGDAKSSILSDVFWDQIATVVELLRPVLKWISILEGDNPEIGAVVEAFAELKAHFHTALPSAPVTKREEKQVKDFLRAREDFCIQTIHKAANLLDPRFCGKNLSEESVVDACEYICKLTSRYHISENDILSDIANYRAKAALWSKEFVWKSAQQVSPLVWWKGICSSRLLSKAAVKILSLPATSAACERSFSMLGNIHSAKRNRLSNATAQKLAYVSQNLKFLGQDTKMQVEAAATKITSETDELEDHNSDDCQLRECAASDASDEGDEVFEDEDDYDDAAAEEVGI